jgi:hypothetical protein
MSERCSLHNYLQAFRPHAWCRISIARKSNEASIGKAGFKVVTALHTELQGHLHVTVKPRL